MTENLMKDSKGIVKFVLKVIVIFLIFFIILSIPNFQGLEKRGMRLLAVAFLMVALWITELVPLFVTALLPIILFPVMGIMTPAEATAPYSNSVIYLFLGGFIIAQTIQERGLHKRIAFTVLRWAGGRPSRILFGLLGTSMFLSMWMSNTATVAMLYPIVLSLLFLLEESKIAAASYSIPFLLAIAYGSSIGGIATLIGTPPNAIFAAYMEKVHHQSITFIDWMKIGVPISLVLGVFLWFYLVLVYKVKNKPIEGLSQFLSEEVKKQGKMDRGEWIIAVLASLAALSWMIGPYLNRWFSFRLDDTGIAVFFAFLCFVIPVNFSKKEFLLPKERLSHLPWSVILIFGGGLSLGDAFKSSGVSAWLAQHMGFLQGHSAFLVVFVISLILSFLTEFTSNTATAAVFMPLIGAMAISMGQNPILLLVPMTLTVSCAFMLPAATPPNAIIFGSERIKLIEMAKVGFLLDIVAVVVISVLTYYMSQWVWGVEIGVLPDWVKK